MPAPFLDSRLEIGIDFGATYGPRFNTAVTRQADGREQRRALWSQPLIVAQLGQRSVTQSQLNYLISFHASVQGAYSGFRLRDWSDFYAVNEIVGTGNGSSQTWQLVKRYSAGGFTVTRPITKPVADSVVVYLDGVEQASGWSVDGATGVLTTALTGVITASFEFDVPVRFEQDKIEFTFKAAGAVNLFELATVTCTEVRIEPTILPALDPLPGELPETIALGYDLETQGGPEFSTQIAMTGAEFESRAALWTTALGQWNLGARTLKREQIDYFLAWFRVCRGQAVPFQFYDWQSSATKRVRFSEDRISFTFQAYRRYDREAIFTLGGAALREVAGNLIYIGITAATGNQGNPQNSEHKILEFYLNDIDILSSSSVFGSAYFHAGEVVLTPAINLQAGALLAPGSLLSVGDFTARFKYSIDVVGSRDDGLAFVITNDLAYIGSLSLSVGGGLGYLGASQKVAVEFDIFQNLTGDPNNNHVAITENSDFVQVNASPGLDLVGVRWVWIDYQSGTLSAFIGSTNVKPASPVVSQVIDINSALS